MPAPCPECRTALLRGDKTCPACGADPAGSVELAPLEVVTPGAPDSARRTSLDNPWFVLGLLFFAMAALGLPILWKCRGLSLPWRIVLSVVVCAYTAVLLWGFWLVMEWSWGRISESPPW